MASSEQLPVGISLHVIHSSLFVTARAMGGCFSEAVDVEVTALFACTRGNMLEGHWRVSLTFRCTLSTWKLDPLCTQQTGKRSRTSAPDGLKNLGNDDEVDSLLGQGTQRFNLYHLESKWHGQLRQCRHADKVDSLLGQGAKSLTCTASRVIGIAYFCSSTQHHLLVPRLDTSSFFHRNTEGGWHRSFSSNSPALLMLRVRAAG
eukprot:1159472-Pelagomonas_calceolata.AAC.3